MFFNWLAAQSYFVEEAIGAFFLVVIAPAVLVCLAAVASWAERPIVDLLRMSGLFDLLKREDENLWQLRAKRLA